MSKPTLTPQQQMAVEDRGGSLLVSAAAGSGKTKVLVERLFRYIMEERCNVDDFLIITYTRAAASELRTKIAEELNRRLAETPEDAHLQRQLLRVYQADIKTVDAFCTALLRENTHLLSPREGERCLTPDFRVLDEDEAQLLRQRVLERVLEAFYDDLSEGGALLADTLGAGRDDGRLVQLVLDLYGKLQSHARPERWMESQKERWTQPGNCLDDTPYGRELLHSVRSKAAYWARSLALARADLAGDEALAKGYGEKFAVAAEGFRALEAAGGWEEAREAVLAVTFPRLTTPKGRKDDPDVLRAKQLWDNAKKELGKLQKLLSVSQEEAMEDLQAVAPAMLALLELTADFGRAYQQEKLRRNVTDFSDQEHLALELLLDQEGSPTELGEQVALRYREILVDEYQDTNEVQNAIFRAVSREGKNLFTVGDVKQSIYRFRLADPGIFLDKYRRFPPAEEAREGEPRKILLSRNFRSRSQVLDGANFIFENIMSTQMGEMDYGEEEKLYFGAEYYLPRTDCDTEFHLLDVAQSRGGQRTVRRALAEARLVAGRIRQLLDEGYPVQDGGTLRPCRPEDIVVLMRSPASRALDFAQALEEQGIPGSSDASADFFTATEVAVVYALLQIIDNPRQDVPLISVLRSPLFGFSADRLASIRAAAPSGDFYTALKADGGEDARAFLAQLEELRQGAQDMSVHRLLWHLYNQLNVLGVFGAMDGGGERRENLIALFEHARRFESSGYRGVFAFVTQLRRLLEAGREPETVTHGSGGGVRLMSIHKSKGLEFPIVILADLSKKFSTMDFQTPVLVHPDLGLGPVRVDLDRRIQYPTVARKALEQVLRRESRSEEMRILYVAMTRPCEKLILVDAEYNAPGHLKKLLPSAACPAHPEAVSGCGSMGDWVLLPLLCRPEAAPLRQLAEMEVPALYTGDTAPWSVFVHSGEEYAQRPAPAAPEVQAEEREEQTVDTTLLDFTYPWKASVQLPAKLTATQLKGREADQEIAEHAALPPRIRPLRQPLFLQGTLGLTPAERGTATHLVLQYLDFHNLDVSGQIQDLCRRRLLTEEQARAVDPGQLAQLLESPLAQRIRQAEKVLREYRFTLLVDARRYEPAAAPEDKVLLQGVVDCCFQDEAGLHVVDFKTDRVEGEAVQARAQLYRPQLTAYSEALTRVLGETVTERVLYFLHTGQTVEL